MEENDQPKTLDDILEIDLKLIIRDMCLGRIGLPTLGEMEELFPAFLSHQRLNKDLLISTGLARTWFAHQPLFPPGFANLYFTRMPARVDVSPMEGGDWHIQYSFLRDWGLIEHVPIFLPSTEEQANIGGYTYVRLPDIEYLPNWLRMKQTAKLTQSAENAAIVPFLSPLDVAEIDRRRGLLYELKEAVIKEISEALQRRTISRTAGLWSRCVECVKSRKISKELLELLLAVEHRCRHLRVPPYHLAEFQVADQSLGGMGELFAAAHWVDLALSDEYYDEMARLWQLLKQRMQQRGQRLFEVDYQCCADLLNEDLKALGMEPKGEVALEEIADWIRFMTFQSAFVAPARLAAELDVETAIIIAVPGEKVSQARAALADIEEKLKAWLPKSDTIDLTLSLVYRGRKDSVEVEDANVLQRQGDMWRIKFRNVEISLRDCQGLRCISHLLINPGKDISAIQLVQLARRADPITTANFDCSSELGDSQDDFALADEKTVADCRSAILEIDRKIGEPGLDETERDELIDKKQRIARYLKASTNKSGKSRRAVSPLERARSAVSMAVSRLNDKLETHHQPLYRHLKQSLNLSKTCTYNPQEETPWNVTS